MNSETNELAHLHQFSTFLVTKKGAAHVAAHVPPACRLRSAHIAAHVAAYVYLSECPENDFSDPIHMIAYPRNIAPQKAPWPFRSKPSHQ